MKAKYLGEWYIDYLSVDNGQEPYLVQENDGEHEGFPLDLFMKSDGEFDGIMTETNTSAIALKLCDSCDGGKLWRIW